MPSFTHSLALVLLTLPGCAQTSQPVSTSAPVVSESAALDASVRAEPVVAASASPEPSSVPAADEAGTVMTRRDDSTAGAEFRSCHADADCIAVERAGCCHNGWKEAVAASQADAYATANPCTKSPRPVCPMFRIRDPRVARCEPQTHLCTMVRL